MRLLKSPFKWADKTDRFAIITHDAMDQARSLQVGPGPFAIAGSKSLA
jgi:hypothetical protein